MLDRGFIVKVSPPPTFRVEKLRKHSRENIWRKSVPSNFQSIGKLKDKRAKNKSYPKRNKQKKKLQRSLDIIERVSIDDSLSLSFLFSFPFFCRAKRFSPIVSARCSIDPFKPDFYEVVSRRTGFHTSGFATSPSRGKSGCENVSVRVVRLDPRDPGSTIVAHGERARVQPADHGAQPLPSRIIIFTIGRTRNGPKDAFFFRPTPLSPLPPLALYSCPFVCFFHYIIST